MINVDGKDANSMDNPRCDATSRHLPAQSIQNYRSHLLKALWPFPRPPPHPGSAGQGQKPSLGSLGLCLIHSPHCSWRVFSHHTLCHRHTRKNTHSCSKYHPKIKPRFLYMDSGLASIGLSIHTPSLSPPFPGFLGGSDG